MNTNNNTNKLRNIVPFDFLTAFEKVVGCGEQSVIIKDFLIEVIELVEKQQFIIQCSPRAMAYLERMHQYSRCSVYGKLDIASCDIYCAIDFSLKGTTIMYKDVVIAK